MSFLADFPDWSLFTERDVPEEVHLLSPVSEMVATLQLCQTNLDEMQKTIENVRSEGLMVLAQQAIFAAQLEFALERSKLKLEQANLSKVYRSLRIIKDQMLTALQDANLKIIIPQGKKFDEIADFVQVVGWKHQEEFTEEVVAEVIEPIVFYNNQLLKQGIVVMGAPLAQADKTPIGTDKFDTTSM
ncbi:MAG TPA: nucleotide exchange factor GrpE [Ktedonobacteraceae bacterium]|nr:nucleotide exchange factor GrpE [Ktedonobacteraceae bacterium]